MPSFPKAFGIVVALAVFVLSSSPLLARNHQITDAEVRQRIIAESIASYPGNCPCPYSTMRNGHRCGGRSAYSRPGGRSPLCFAEDVTDGMVLRYRQSHGDGTR